MHIKPVSTRIRTLPPIIAAFSLVAFTGGYASGEQLPPEDQAFVGEALDEAPAVEVIEGEVYVGLQSRAESFLAENITPAFSFLSWHSEETPGSSQCGRDQVVTGFDCYGSFCDYVRIECHDYGTSVDPAWSLGFSDWFEHNGKKLHQCPVGYKMTGIDCWGDYCDNIAIECTYAPGLATARCAWSDWYSEEDPSPFYANVGDAIQGIWCSGTHCDNKRFLVCET